MLNRLKHIQCQLAVAMLGVTRLERIAAARFSDSLGHFITQNSQSSKAKTLAAGVKRDDLRELLLAWDVEHTALAKTVSDVTGEGRLLWGSAREQGQKAEVAAKEAVAAADAKLPANADGIKGYL